MGDAMRISRTGMDVEWQRLQVIAENMANLNTTRTASGEPYRPKRLVSGPEASFAAAMTHRSSTGVRVTGVEQIASGVRRVYDPSDPAADTSGFVSLPDIDQAGEMTLMIRASRAYEADLTVLGIAHGMATRALDLGRTS